MNLYQMRHIYGKENAAKVGPAYQEFLASQGPISRLFSKLVPKTNTIPALDLTRFEKIRNLAQRFPTVDVITDGLKNFNPSQVAELYGRTIRPSVGRALQRTPHAALAGLLGAGMLAADQVQDRVTGG
jgi:hypothetical protein